MLILNGKPGLMKLSFFIALLLPFYLSTDVWEDTVYYTNSGQAEFTSSVPLHSFTGTSNHLAGLIDLRENVIDFYLDLNTLRTGIDRRDRDMFRTLNVEEFPFTEFSGEFRSVPDTVSSEEQAVTAVGEFTVNGVTRDVEIEGTLTRSGQEVVLDASWILLLEDYEIEPPGILFYRVDDAVEVSIHVILEPHPREQFFSENISDQTK